MTDKNEQGAKPEVMSIESLTRTGGIVPDKPIAREIEWADGRFQVFVRRLGIGAQEQLLVYSAELERGDERSATALALSKTICFDAEGNDSMSFMDAYRLSDALAVKLMAEVTAVNGGVR